MISIITSLPCLSLSLLHRRLSFKRDLGCKGFKWYLDNVFPQKFVLDDPEHAAAHGRVRNAETALCLDTMQADEKGKDTFRLGAYPCHDYQVCKKRGCIFYLDYSHT